MLLITDQETLIQEVCKLKQFDKIINFIPTMGNFHLGHESLFKKSENDNEVIITSIFVNPLQFNDINDFESYPRTPELDKKKLINKKVDILFLPKLNFINGTELLYNLGDISQKLCGRDRKGHFEGVAKIIVKFLGLIRPNFITLGEKDYQQVLIIKKIIKDFKFNTKVRISPTIRDKDDVALSSRNQLIENFFLASYIPRILKQIVSEIEAGDFKLIKIDDFKESLKTSGIMEVIYLEILKEIDLTKPDNQPSKCRVFISVSIKGIRLIDNMAIRGHVKLFEDKITT